MDVRLAKRTHARRRLTYSQKEKFREIQSQTEKNLCKCFSSFSKMTYPYGQARPTNYHLRAAGGHRHCRLLALSGEEGTKDFLAWQATSTQWTCTAILQPQASNDPGHWHKRALIGYF
jgi:hypothetical protein